MSSVQTGKRKKPWIPWSPWCAREHIADAIVGEPSTGLPFDSVRHEYWGPTGRWLLGSWLGHLNLDRSDVVTVLTTSQEPYVSICVSVTAFNLASVSRVVTDRTRVIIVIHEFGYVDAAFPKQCEEWRARGIIVLEDCAHVAGITVGSAYIGDYGDAALFSLPKIIPARVGGLLRTREPFRLPAMDGAAFSATMEGKAAAEAALPYIGSFNDLRKERHQLLRNGLGLSPWEPPEPTVSVPWFSMYSDPQKGLYETSFPDVYWGTATLVPDRVQISTNPLVPLCEFEMLISCLQS